MAKKSEVNLEMIEYDPGKGPITIEVTSGYSTLGTFILAYAKKGDYAFQEFGKEPKRIDDNIPDVFLIPLPLDDLPQYRVVIIGKYKTAPGHNQVEVTYRFFQDGKSIHETTIEIEASEDYQRTSNKYEFARKG